MAFFEQRGDSGLNSVIGSGKADDFVQSFRTQVSIDSFCAARGLSPDVIKIDVEGNELQVLRGGAATIRKAHPLIFLSVHPRQIGLLGGNVESLAQIIAELGYETRNPDGRGAQKLEFREYVLHPLDRL